MAKYVEPSGYFSPSMKKILKAGESRSSAKKPAAKSTTKKTTKK